MSRMSQQSRRNPQALPFSPWWVAGVGGAVAVGGIVYAVASLVGDSLPPGVVAPANQGVPFAKISRPRWPLVTRSSQKGVVSYQDINGRTHGNYQRRFGAPRGGRRHAGIDLFGNAGDPVVAVADGIVVRTQTFELGTDAILVDHGSAVVLYGEVDPGSWRRVGVSVGSRVRRGQQIASVGCMVWSGNSCSSHMLHLETYRTGTRENQRWSAGSRAPAALLDPTRMLLVASKTA
jgi:murein DD-endopeptidase MepM/ murein hydrolase activator NlpD